MTVNKRNPQGLLLEEALLYEQSHSGRIGVDFRAVSLSKDEQRTGLPLRESIGLPEVSEPQVVRHFVRLSQKNYGIDSGFFPLGSCTMKHNPRLNEKLARLSGFSQIHPLQPQSTVQGMLELMFNLQNWLNELSGLAQTTLCPAAGAHGELTGMMMIRAAHEDKGNARKVVLVPDSAHGTNPATAAMNGYKIVEIKSDTNGLVDIQALDAAIEKHGTDIAAFMLTNPSTCGLFEPNILNIAEKIHKIGAYFYCDGANFNAIVGKIKPADLGIDVMQYNLHKTFSTPHGGGGPGSGPVSVCAELTPYLPIPLIVKEGDNFKLIEEAPKSIGKIKGFHGQAGMFVRAYAYMLSHGKDGLKQVAEAAVLNANYIMHSLKDDYFMPFNGPCMHECLFTDKQQKETGVTTIDIAKGLTDYGFHPMTTYFPLIVGGAMLIEPTETEPKEAIDEFILTMKELANIAQQNPEAIKQMPQHTPRKRLDEVTAARNPILTYQMSRQTQA